MSKYKIGEEITTTYQNPPVAKDSQYFIGKMISVFDEATNEKIAEFIVEKSDSYKVNGLITWVKPSLLENQKKILS